MAITEKELVGCNRCNMEGLSLSFKDQDMIMNSYLHRDSKEQSNHVC